MNKKLFLFASLFIIFILSIYLIAADCNGCQVAEVCYYSGDIANTSGVFAYCDINGSFISQKAENQACLNDFECLEGACIEDICTNYLRLWAENQDLSDQITAYNAALSISCGTSPGCLNLASLENAGIVAGLCAFNYPCFQCNSGYSWTGGSCLISPGPEPSSGGNNYNSGGVSWTTTRVLSDSELANGASFNLKPMQRVQFNINSQARYVGLFSIRTGAVDLIFFSVLDAASLKSFQKSKYDITGDANPDFELTLIFNSVAGNNATFYIKAIQAASPSSSTPGLAPVVIPLETPTPKSSIWKAIIISIIIIILIALAIVAYVLIKKSKQKPKSAI